MSVTMNKRMSLNHYSTLVGQALKLGHWKEQDCIGGLKVELRVSSKHDLGAQFKDKVTLHD